jgi:hypothetical protein
MLPEKQFTGADYDRMAKELEDLAAIIHKHPGMNHHTSERLKTMAKEMRGDAKSEYLKS